LQFHSGGAIGLELMGNVPLGILLRGKRIRDRHPISVAAVPDHVPLAIRGILCDFVLLSHLFPPLHDVLRFGAKLHLLGGLVRYTNRSKESERLGLAEEVHSLAWAKLNPPVPV
jgi:hypothetical protein